MKKNNLKMRTQTSILKVRVKITSLKIKDNHNLVLGVHLEIVINQVRVVIQAVVVVKHPVVTIVHNHLPNNLNLSQKNYF
jgi:hypothetical protein